jgi:hypothetical protein
MLPKEAQKLGDVLSALPTEFLSPLVNLGSSTEAFRRHQQPHIQERIFAPLERRGVRAVHADLKPEDGVDIIGDVYDPAFQGKVRAIEPRLILCCNMLEHVVDRHRFADACSSLLPPGGHLLVSVPYSFPYHTDPIDTLYRPSPRELLALFSGLETLDAGIVVEESSYFTDLRDRRWGAKDLFDFAVVGSVRFLTPWWRFQSWMNRFHPMLWLWRRYKVTYALLRKPAGSVG